MTTSNVASARNRDHAKQQAAPAAGDDEPPSNAAPPRRRHPTHTNRDAPGTPDLSSPAQIAAAVNTVAERSWGTDIVICGDVAARYHGIPTPARTLALLLVEGLAEHWYETGPIVECAAGTALKTSSLAGSNGTPITLVIATGDLHADIAARALRWTVGENDLLVAAIGDMHMLNRANANANANAAHR